MKKTLKQIFSLLIVASMLLSMVTVAVASVEKTTFSITEEVHDAAKGIKKLVFSVETPQSTNLITTTEIIFSYDATKIMPVSNPSDIFGPLTDNKLTSSSNPTMISRSFVPFYYLDMSAFTEHKYTIQSPKAKEYGNRVAVQIVTQSTTPYTANNGMKFVEFYFRTLVDDSKLDSETFMFETDYSEGSPLKDWSPVEDLAASMKVIDKDAIIHAYGKYKGEDTAVLSEFTYTGSNVPPVYPLKNITLTPAVATVEAPTVIPAENAETVVITAKAINTKDQEMGLPADAVWSLKSAPAGVTLSNTGVLTVAPNAQAGVATIALTSGGKEYTTEVAVTRATPVAAQITLTANGADVANYAVVKPITFADPAKTVNFAATAKDQYGEAFAANIAIDASALNGTSFANNTLTVNSGADNGNITVTATLGTLTDSVNVKITSLEVNWLDVNATEITYGQTIAEGIEFLNNNNKGTASVDGTVYNGVFSVVNGTATPTAGTANVQVAFKITDEGEFKDLVITNDFTVLVNKANYNMNAVTVADKAITYNGQAQELTVSGTLPSGVSVSNITYNGSTEKPVNAGSYAVVVSFTGDSANYNPIPDKTATLTINKAKYDLSGIIISAKEVTYNGSAQKIDLPNLPEGITVSSVTYNGSGNAPVNAGTYNVVVSFVGSDTVNYETITETKSATLTVNKATYDLSGVVISAKEVTYNGSAQEIDLPALPEGITVSSVTYNGSTDKPVNAGTYNVVVSFTGNSDNYNLIPSKTSTLVIKKAPYTLSGITVADKTVIYNGLAQEIDLPALPEGITVSSVTYNGSTDKPVNAGTYDVIVSFASNLANYEPITETKTATLTIKKAKYDLSGVVLSDKAVTYNGHAQEFELPASIPSGVNAYVAYNGDSNKPVNAGTYNITVSFSGDLANYENITERKTATFTIQKAPVTVKAKDITIRVGSLIPALEYEIISGTLFGNDAISGSLTTDCTSTNAEGQYTIDGNLSAPDNYNLTFVKGTLKVVNKEIQNIVVEGIEETKTYGDAGFKITAIPDSVSGLSNFTFSSSDENVATIDQSGNITIKNAGATVISVKEAGNDVYAPFEKTFTLTVNKARYDLSGVVLNNKTVIYNSLAQEIDLPINLPSSVTVSSITYNGTAQAPVNAGTYNVIVSFAGDLTNYEPIAETKTATLTINKANYDLSGVTVSAEPVTYNGQAHEATVTGVPAGVLVANITYNGSTEKPVNAGTYQVTVSFAGSDITNFEAVTETKSATLTIGKALITVKANDIKIKIGKPIPTFEYLITSGTLFGNDAISGSLTTNCTSTDVTGIYAITQGDLTAGDNYELTVTPGVLEIINKTPQDYIKVDGTVTEAVYGDAGFRVIITPDSVSGLNNFILSSSDENVATIDETGYVTIKNAGITTISVVELGNAEYAPFEKTWTLTVKKLPITITADYKAKKIGQSDPELTYTVNGNLVEGDAITGALERTPGEDVGKYDILQGTLTISDNYEIDFIPGIFEIFDKEIQTITIANIDEKTYGNEAFTLGVTSTSGLDTFTFESNDTRVVQVAHDGTVTITGAGKATITVKQAGNDDYAEATAAVEIIINPAVVKITALDMDNKAAAFEGILDADAATVELDFDSIKTTVVSSEKTDGASTITTTVTVTNFVLKGEKAENYITDQKASLTTTVVSEAISDNLTSDENVTVEAAPVDDKTIIVTDVAVNPESEVQKVTIDATAVTNSKVNTVAMPTTAIDSIIKAHEDAVLELILTDGSAENKSSTINFNATALNTVYEAVYASVYGQNIQVPTISISVNNTPKAELAPAQQTTVDNVSTKSPVVYTLSITNSLGETLASASMGGFGAGGLATLNLPYVKPAGNGNVIVKYMDDFGNLTNIANPVYNPASQLVTIALGHFSEYLIYTEPVTSQGGYGGGGVVSKYTVKFETNGGSEIKSLSVNKNEVVAKPADPIKEGFKFDGWFTDKALTKPYDFATNVTKALTLYAKWSENEKEPEKEEPVPPATKVVFKDVAETDWFYTNVQYVVNNGLMKGMSEDEFAPNNTLTRAMLVTVLYRNAGEPATNRSIPFADIDMGSYYANAVSWAKQNGIVNGVTENEFAPNNNITREQIAAIMFRYAQYKGMNAITLEENLHFADSAKISEYAISAMNWAVGTGLMKGKSETTINPKDNATRAEIAAILQRFIESNK